MAAGRAGRPRGRAEPREDDVRWRLDGRRAGLDDDDGAGTTETWRSSRAGVDDDRGAGMAETTRSTL